MKYFKSLFYPFLAISLLLFTERYAATATDKQQCHSEFTTSTTRRLTEYRTPPVTDEEDTPKIIRSHTRVVQNQDSSTEPQNLEDYFFLFSSDIKLLLLEELSVPGYRTLLLTSKKPVLLMEDVDKVKDLDNGKVCEAVMKKVITGEPLKGPTQEDVRRYSIRIRINIESDPTKIDDLMKKYLLSYDLNKDHPFLGWKEAIILKTAVKRAP